MTSRTLYLLVTCSMEDSRAELAKRVVENLIEQHSERPFLQDLLVFDNASKFDHHLGLLPPYVRALKCDRNIGYWSAIYWVLHNFEDVMRRSYDYIYIIESDLIHYDMFRLDEAENFLNDHPKIGGIRTQEFSVRWRAFYDKRNRFLPFARRDSWVWQTNQFTGARVWFQSGDRRARIYVSNIVAKLPSLNRVGAMRPAFDSLREKENIVETDFMRAYHELYPEYAVLDGGIFRMISNYKSEHISGSYSKISDLSRLDYRQTRMDKIVCQGFSVSLVRGGSSE